MQRRRPTFDSLEQRLLFAADGLQDLNVQAEASPILQATIVSPPTVDGLPINIKSAKVFPEGESVAESFVQPIGDQQVALRSPLHIPATARGIFSGPIGVTVEVDDPSLVEASVLQGNRSIRMSIANFGEMIFELFEQRAPNTTGRIAQLVQDNFYSGIDFHRVIDDFVIQAGDPTGTGAGGSELGDFDDEFHPDLQYNRPGVIGFAKASDDTNNSQFFVTEIPSPHLNFNHSVFGQLVKGEDVREAISEVETDRSNSPVEPVEITNIELFEDNRNSVILLKPRGLTGTTNVTVTTTNSTGIATTQTFQVDVVDNEIDSPPFLSPIIDPAPVPINTVSQLQLSSIDIDGDPVSYGANLLLPNATVDVTTDGLVTVTPPQDFVGDVDVRVSVRPINDNGSNADFQSVTFTFGGPRIDLVDSSDSGVSSTDNVTNQRTLSFLIDQVNAGDVIEFSVGEQTIGQTTALANIASITTNGLSELGDGTHIVRASRLEATGQRTEISHLPIVFDSTAPVSLDLSGANLMAFAEETYELDLDHDEEGAGLRYSPIQFPENALLDPVSGLIEWTPTFDQDGEHTFIVSLTDVAGNERVEVFQVQVATQLLAAIRLEITDQQGNVRADALVGERLLLNMYGADQRTPFQQRGVLAAYADLNLSPELRTVAGTEIVFGQGFVGSRSGSIEGQTVDELGAAHPSLNATNQPESLIATIQIDVVRSGNAIVESSAAGTIGNDILLFGLDDPVQTQRVSFGTVSLDVQIGNHNSDLPEDVNGDSSVTASDALAILNAIGRANGPIRISQTLPEFLEANYLYNVTPDGLISALDALAVINRLSQNNLSGSGEAIDRDRESENREDQIDYVLSDSLADLF